MLSRREHSARELQRKLEQRGVTGEEAAQVVEDLAKDGWQSDERYAAMLVRTRVANGYGPRRIDSELRQAGVSSEVASRALEDCEADWQQLCAELNARRFRTPPTSAAERAKRFRFLMSRGFESDQIRAALEGNDTD